MSKDAGELRERAEEGNLTEDDLAYLRMREGVPTFDAIRAMAPSEPEDDEPEFDEDDLYADLSYAELKQELDGRGVEYRGNASADDLRALLVADDEE